MKPGLQRFTKAELDGACDSDQFGDEFLLDLVFRTGEELAPSKDDQFWETIGQKKERETDNVENKTQNEIPHYSSITADARYVYILLLIYFSFYFCCFFLFPTALLLVDNCFLLNVSVLADVVFALFQPFL